MHPRHSTMLFLLVAQTFACDPGSRSFDLRSFATTGGSEHAGESSEGDATDAADLGGGDTGSAEVSGPDVGGGAPAAVSDSCGFSARLLELDAQAQAAIRASVCNLGSSVYTTRVAAQASLETAIDDAIGCTQPSECRCFAELTTWLFQSYTPTCATQPVDAEVGARLAVVAGHLAARCNADNPCANPALLVPPVSDPQLTMWPMPELVPSSCAGPLSPLMADAPPAAANPPFAAGSVIDVDPMNPVAGCRALDATTFAVRCRGVYECDCKLWYSSRSNWNAGRTTNGCPNLAPVDECPRQFHSSKTRYWKQGTIGEDGLQASCLAACRDETRICEDHCVAPRYEEATCCTNIVPREDGGCTGQDPRECALHQICDMSMPVGGVMGSCRYPGDDD